MTMPGRSYTAQSTYRYGFNGKEKDNSTGDGNLDFGARIYDGRIGRFLSVDPDGGKNCELSSYSFANNSPVFLIDFNGRFPKVAIIMFDKNKPFEFDDHLKSLRNQGYKIIKVTNGQELIQAVKDNSTKASPIKNLTLLSHAFDHGMIAQHTDDGFYEDNYLVEPIRIDLERDKYDLYFNGIVTNPSSKSFDKVAFDKATKNYNDDINSPKFAKEVDDAVDKFKKDNGTATISDLKAAVGNKEAFLSNDAKIIVGGCNAAGYETTYDAANNKLTLDKSSFAYNLAITVVKTVIASVGFTAPIENSGSRTSTGAWISISGTGDAKVIAKPPIKGSAKCNISN